MFATENSKGWKMIHFLLGWPIFRGDLLVLGRVGSLFLVVHNNFEPPSDEPSSKKRTWFSKTSKTTPAFNKVKVKTGQTNTGWWFQPPLKTISQNGNLPLFGVKIKNI